MPGQTPPLRIGRLPDSEIHIDEPFVSRRHAEIYCNNSSYFVQDTGSANGTSVNNQNITQPTELNSGDTIGVGSAKIIFQRDECAPVLKNHDDYEPTQILRLSKEPPTKDMLAPLGLLETVAEIARQIVQNKPLEELLNIILRLCVEKTNAERAALLLLDDEGQLTPRAFFSNAESAAEFIISKTIAQKTLDERQAILVEDAITNGNQAMSESVFNLRIRSAICTPLWKDDKTVGVLYVDTSLPDRLFGEIDLLFFSSLSGMIAEKIEIGLLEQVAKEKHRLDAELKIASEIQARLFPENLPQIDGYDLTAHSRPCTEVGGDYFDIVATDDSFGIAIGDVTGKGVGAAMLMSNLQALLRSRAAEFSDPAALLTRMNTDLFGRLGDDRFVTFFYLTLNPADGRFVYVNAGHNSPLLCRASGEVLPLEVSGLPLGIFSASPYETFRDELQPGDLLLLYSDGITECANAAGELFGEERLCNVLRRSMAGNTASIKQAILSAVDDFRLDAPYTDDLTLVVLKRP